MCDTGYSTLFSYELIMCLIAIISARDTNIPN